MRVKLLFSFFLLSGGFFFFSSPLNVSFDELSFFSFIRRNTSRAFSLVLSNFTNKTHSIPLKQIKDLNLNCIKDGETREFAVNARHVRLIGKLCSSSSLKSVKITELNHHFQVTHFLLSGKQAFSSDYFSLNQKQTPLRLNLMSSQGKNVSMRLLLIQKAIRD